MLRGLWAVAAGGRPFPGVRITSVRASVYVEETLAPILKQGDTVVLDTLPAHKVSGIRERIEAAGVRLLYLPAYSPDCNPTDLAFAKLKLSLRAQAARTVADLCDTIKQAFRRFTPDECRNYLMAAGYNAFDPARSDAGTKHLASATDRLCSLLAALQEAAHRGFSVVVVRLRLSQPQWGFSAQQTVRSRGFERASKRRPTTASGD